MVLLLYRHVAPEDDSLGEVDRGQCPGYIGTSYSEH